MGYKDILVYADNAKYATNRLDAAARLAVMQDAHLTALHINRVPYMPVDLGGAAMGAQFYEWQQTIRKEKAEKVRKVVDDASARHGINIEWREQEGLADDVLMSQGAYADLIVVSQAGDPFDLEQPVDPSPGVLALSSGRPIMVVPNRAGEYQIGNNVLVAWKPCAESARAVHDALPILAKAQSVTILEANPDVKPGRGRLVGAEIAKHLARHGVTVSAMSLQEKWANEGSAILARAAEIGADLIVMGGYGHSRLREVVLGGVTHHLLKHHHIPILMAH